MCLYEIMVKRILDIFIETFSVYFHVGIGSNIRSFALDMDIN